MILGERSVEDYYPVEIVVKAIKELFGIDVKKEDIGTEKPRDK